MNDEDLKDTILEVSEKCEIGKVYHKTGFKPVVSVSCRRIQWSCGYES